jgi:ribosomal protein L11 methyltransferase
MDRQTWAQVKITVPAEAADAVADFLTTLSRRGVTLEEGQGGVRITAYLDPKMEEWNMELTRYLADLREMGILADRVDPEIVLIPDEDWMSVFRAQHSTVRISDRLVIRPTWCEPEQGREVVLDPGLAFGTGSHATTHLSLTLMDGHMEERTVEKVLDLGTGTGVLAIAAAFLGAPQVLAVDNDPMAVEVARQNVGNNGVADTVTVVEGGVEDLPDTYDLILANLSASLLKRLASHICSALEPDGTLIISGVTRGEQEEIREAFLHCGLRFEALLTRDIWIAASLSRRGGGLPPG